MKRALAAAVGVVAALSAPAFGGETPSRTVTGEYNTLRLSVSEDPPAARGSLTNGVEFKAKRGERSVTFVIDDMSGLPARAVVARDLDGDGRMELGEVEREFCGRTDRPLRVQDGEKLTVWAQQGGCDEGQLAASTFGTVTATFKR